MTDRKLRYAARVQVWNQKKYIAAGGIVYMCGKNKIGRQMADPNHIDTNPEGNWWWVWLHKDSEDLVEDQELVIDNKTYVIEEMQWIAHRKSGSVLLK